MTEKIVQASQGSFMLTPELRVEPNRRQESKFLARLQSCGVIREIGLFLDPAATGKLFARSVITAVTLNSGDSGRVDYEIQL